MSTVFIILAIVIVAIILSVKIQSLGFRIEGLRKEIRNLQENLKKQETTSPLTVPEPTETIVQQESVPQTTEPLRDEKVISQEEAETVTAESTPEMNPSAPSPKVISTPVRKRKINYEKLIGENLFGKIGILILVAGMGLFVKYAIDNEWINETMRTILGFMTGLVLLFISKRIHTQYRTFSSLLAGGSFAMFYVTTAIAYHYYGLFSQTTAFILLILFTLLMSGLSILYNRRELASIAITGGFLAPFLVSNGAENYITLFTYILILNSGMFIIAMYKKWGELPIISFFFTWLCLLIYLFHSSSAEVSDGLLFFFTTAYYLIFLLPIMLTLKDQMSVLNQILSGIILLNHFVFLGFGLHFLKALYPDIKLNGMLTLSIALINSGVAILAKKQLHESKLLFSLSLATAITFVSLSIPLQFEGNFIPVFWASEMILLLYLSIRSQIRLYEYFSFLLAILTFISLKITIYSLSWADSAVPDTTFFLNGTFFTRLYAGLSFLVYARLLMKFKIPYKTGNHYYIPLNVISLGIACFIFWYTPSCEFRIHITDDTLVTILQSAYLGLYLLCLSIIFRKRFPIPSYLSGYLIGAGINTGIFILTFFCNGNQWIEQPYNTVAWIYLIIILIQLFLTSRTYYSQIDYQQVESKKYTIILNIMTTICLLLATWLFLHQLSLGREFKAGFSICLAIIGFIQMICGMRLHFRLLRGISLVTFGIVLLKLVILDIWQLPTIGKIIVFILLGIVLLLLSFMYQKLKNVLW